MNMMPTSGLKFGRERNLDGSVTLRFYAFRGEEMVTLPGGTVFEDVTLESGAGSFRRVSIGYAVDPNPYAEAAYGTLEKRK